MTPYRISCLIPSSPYLADQTTNPPLGLLSIAAVLREAGHEVSVSPLAITPWKDLPQADLHLIGFTTPQFNEALCVADFLKQRDPHTTIVAGGSHPTYEPWETKWAGPQEDYHPLGVLTRRRDYYHPKTALFDSVVVGEGEGLILPLIHDWELHHLYEYYICDVATLPDLDTLPLPAWDLLPQSWQQNHGAPAMKGAWVESSQHPGTYPMYSLSVTRGCPYRCLFCATPHTGTLRYRSPETVLRDLQRATRHGIRMVCFQDDTFTIQREQVRALALAVQHAIPPPLAVRLSTRVNTVDETMAGYLEQLSCKVCCFGIESGSQAVLDANRKGTTVEQNTRAVAIAKAHGFKTHAFLMCGLAGETAETARATRDWIRTARPDTINLTMAIPHPGTRYWTHPQASGVEILDYNYDHQWIVGWSARDSLLMRPLSLSLSELHTVKRDQFQFLTDEGYAKPEWTFDRSREGA